VVCGPRCHSAGWSFSHPLFSIARSSGSPAPHLFSRFARVVDPRRSIQGLVLWGGVAYGVLTVLILIVRGAGGVQPAVDCTYQLKGFFNFCQWAALY